jgi:hypothetical protein
VIAFGQSLREGLQDWSAHLTSPSLHFVGILHSNSEKAQVLSGQIIYLGSLHVIL